MEERKHWPGDSRIGVRKVGYMTFNKEPLEWVSVITEVSGWVAGV